MHVLTLDELQKTYSKWQREEDQAAVPERRMIVGGDEDRQPITADQVKAFSRADSIPIRGV